MAIDLTLSTKFNNPEHSPSLPLISVSEFKDLMLSGIPMTGSYGETLLTDESARMHILVAQQFIEKQFAIKLQKQIVQESKDLSRNDLYASGFIRLTYPAIKPYELKGRLNEREIIDYPKQWLIVKRSNQGLYYRNLFILPNGEGEQTFIQTYYGNSVYFGFMGLTMIPNYWWITYCTGFDSIPKDLLMFIMKLAAINALLQIELGIGAAGNPGMFGLASNSLSLDGLSQSVSKMNGGNLFQQRIKQYWDEFNTLFPMMKGIYSPVTLEVI